MQGTLEPPDVLHIAPESFAHCLHPGALHGPLQFAEGNADVLRLRLDLTRRSMVYMGALVKLNTYSGRT